MAYTRVVESSGDDERMPSQRRATAVTKWLLQGRRLRAKACAEQLGVSKRAFYGIMDVVSLELPLVNVKGDWFVPLEARIEMGVAASNCGRTIERGDVNAR